MCKEAGLKFLAPRNPHLLLKYQAALARHVRLSKNQPAVAAEAEKGIDDLWEELVEQRGDLRKLSEEDKLTLYDELQIYVGDMMSRNRAYANAVELKSYELV